MHTTPIQALSLPYNNQLNSSSPPLSRTYIQSKHNTSANSSVLFRLKRVQDALIVSASRASKFRNAWEMECDGIEYKRDAERLERDEVDRIERSKRIGSWINETLRHSRQAPISKNNRTSSNINRTSNPIKLPSISTLLSRSPRKLPFTPYTSTMNCPTHLSYPLSSTITNATLLQAPLHSPSSSEMDWTPCTASYRDFDHGFNASKRTKK